MRGLFGYTRYSGYSCPSDPVALSFTKTGAKMSVKGEMTLTPTKMVVDVGEGRTLTFEKR